MGGRYLHKKGTGDLPFIGVDGHAVNIETAGGVRGDFEQGDVLTLLRRVWALGTGANLKSYF